MGQNEQSGQHFASRSLLHSPNMILPSGKVWPYIVLLFCMAATPDIYAGNNGYLLEIIKSSQELHLKRGNHIIKTYKIAHGKQADGKKQQLGDNKTPVGKYLILDFKADSQFYYFMQINYPNLVDAWHGYKNQLISPGEFKNIATAHVNRAMPPQDTALGGYIGIHGLGDINKEKLTIHNSYNWTQGCIALTNGEVNELRKYVSIGTPIIIKE